MQASLNRIQHTTVALLLLLWTAQASPIGHFLQNGNHGGYLLHHVGNYAPKEEVAVEGFGGHFPVKEQEADKGKVEEALGGGEEADGGNNSKDGNHGRPVSAQLKNSQENEDSSKASYKFEYAVHDPHTGDVKRQWEHREGGVVKGQYSLIEPDGSLRTVHYSAHPKTGFHATVRKHGVNKHPVTKHHAASASAVGEHHHS